MINVQEYPGPSHRVKKTMAVEKTQIGLKESGVQLNLTIVDTPGFGDNVRLFIYLNSIMKVNN